MTECSRCTFTLESTTTAVYLSLPEWSGEDRAINKNIDLFDFWTAGELSTVDKGKNNEPLRLTGIEQICGENEGLCFPMCFPLCFGLPLSKKFSKIWAIQNAHDEVTISGLGDCMDGTYVIKNFHFESIYKIPGTYRWSLDLEKTGSD